MNSTHDEAFTEHLNFFRRQLDGGAPFALELPAAGPRPPAGDTRYASLNSLLPPELSADVRARASEAGLSTSDFLLAGLKALLFRYGRQTPVVVCIAADGGRAAQGRLGDFLSKWAVLGTHVLADMSFEQLARGVRQGAEGVREQKGQLTERLVPEVDALGGFHLDALSAVAFDFQGGTPHGGNGNGSRAGSNQQEAGAETNGTRAFKFDLRFSLSEVGGQIGLSVEYNSGAYEEATVARLAGHLQTLLGAAAKDPRLPVGELSLMSEAERYQMLVEWNETRTEFPSHLCAQQLFEARAAEAPDAPAARFGQTQLTYRELNERANRLAHYLRAVGVGPEQIVGICLEGSLEMPVAILGVLKAGGAYLPLDPAYPAGRIGYMVEDAGIKLILTQQALTEKLKGVGAASLVALDGEPNVAADRPSENPELLTTSRNACYVIYTSGSTGRPKGIVIEHHSLVNLVGALKSVCDVGPGDRVLQFASFSFDQSVREVFEALLGGATLCLARREEMMPGKPLIDVLEGYGITAVTLAPSVLAHLPEAALHELTKLSAGGEALPGSVVDRWAVGRSFFNAYGPSEVTFASSLPRCFAGAGKPSIGGPLANVRYYVVDERMQPCPVGVTGELLVGGEGLARGYLGRPGLTAERFIPDPFSGEAGGRLYRTGDLVRWMAGGEVDYLGRADQQVKVRGLRIELGEIEAVLMEHKSVAAATVNVFADAPGRERLAAYLAPSGGDLPLDELKRLLASRVPDYMVPSIFIPVERIPLTPAGKVDRSALPPPDSVRRQKAPTTPATPAEQKMADIWKRVLEVDSVSVDDNFFELGGSSIKGTALLTLIQEAFNVRPSFAKVFEHPRLRDLTEVIIGSAARESSADARGAVLLRKGAGRERHIFFVHDSSGSVEALLPLSSRLAPAWNVWGIQAGPLDPEETPEVSIEGLAAEYLDEMRAIQPDGPWFVGGWSFGGIIAYEMTRQLEAAGGWVELLTFIDSDSPNRERWEAVLTEFLDAAKAAFKPAAAAVSSVADKGKASQLLLGRISRYANAAERVRACVPDTISRAIAGWEQLDEPRLFEALHRVISYIAALSVYEAGGRVAAAAEDFRASVRPEHVEGDDWGAFVGGRLRLRVLDGDHRSILSPPAVESLADALNEALEERCALSAS